MLKKKMLFLALIALSFNGYASQFPESVKFHRDGRFSLKGAEFKIIAFNSRWHSIDNRKWKECKSKSTNTSFELQGVIFFDGAKGIIKETLKAAPKNGFSLEAAMTFDSPVKANGLFGGLTLPLKSAAITIDGKVLKIPGKFEKMRLFSGKPGTVEIRLQGGNILSIAKIAKIHIQDNRKFKNDTVTLRFGFSPMAGTISKAKLKLCFQLRKMHSIQVDTTKIVNRSLCDEVAGDGKGGWTDQGPEEDLRMFKPGNVEVMGLSFHVPDPAKNHGNAVAVLGGNKRGGLPRELTLSLPDTTGMHAVNLLHSSAWTPGGEFGEMEFVMADGSRKKQSLTGLRDCGNWVNPRSLDNGYLAWEGKRIGAKVGVYVSSFDLPEGKVRKIVFRSKNSKVAWMILGVSLSEELVNFPKTGMHENRIVAGKDWIKLDFRAKTVKGSALDFSNLVDAPAGKYGFVKVASAGTLTFENAPGKRLRLHGINLCQTANFPSKKLANQMADTFASLGFNSVRFHHHDNYLALPSSKDSMTLNPETLDRMDYFFAACKKRGLYVTTDFYTSRHFKPGDNIPEGKMHPKSLFPLSKMAMKNWKNFTRKWMKHRNPYTGMTWGEDPALAAVNLVNEDNITRFWNKSVASRDMYARKFKKWKVVNNCPKAKADNGDRNFLKFLCETQLRSLDEMARFVKSELKLKTLVTSLNHHQETYLTPMRDSFKLVDNHLYHSHPSFIGKSWRLPTLHSQASSINIMASLPRTLMATRVSGKPFMVTEYNYCRPNKFRAEGGPLIGAYAALQNWDGVYRFCYSHNIKRVTTSTRATGSFESVNDPIMQLSDRIVAALYLKGDVQAAAKSFSYSINPDLIDSKNTLTFPLKFQILGLISRIGSHVAGKTLPSGTSVIKGNAEYKTTGNSAITRKWRDAVERKIAISSTDELKLDGNRKTFVVKTPRTECITLPKGKLATGGILSVSGVDTFQTIAAIALDGMVLRDSRRILILQLSDVENSEITFGNEAHTILKSLGHLPLLLRRAKAEVGLTLSPGKALTVTALSADGEKRGNVVCTNRTNNWSFVADNAAFPGGIMAYEVTR